jgi:serine/threonine-protein kinase
MGEVYRARDTRLKREVALKVLPDGFAKDPDRLARFQREAELLATLNHPNIAYIHGLEDADGIRALVMELVDGPTLADRIARAPVPIEEALPVAHQIAEALEAAHEKGIIHRDLKPANIKVTLDGKVKVLDFGLGKMLESEAAAPSLSMSPTQSLGATYTGVILGTAPYMSPEQARGKLVDKRTDIWTFGCVVYELLTGRKAFGGETVSDTIVAILEREPDWSALPERTPSTIRRLLQRSLEKDPKRRLHDIADARLEIADAWREPVASSARESIGGERRVGAPARSIWALAAAAVLLVTFGVAAAVVWWPGRVTPRQSSLARLMITLPAAQALERGRYPPVALSPDGRLLVYAAAVNGGRTSLYRRKLDELVATPIAATDGASTPFFSPDGRWLAFYAKGMLKKVSVEGGVPLTICEVPPVWSATWGEDDNIVFATTVGSSGLWQVSAGSSEPIQITTPKPDDIQHGYPQLLPGGKQLLFSVQRRNGWHLALLELVSRDWRVLGKGVIGEGAQLLPTGHLVYMQSGGMFATPFDPSNGNLDQPPVSLFEHIETSPFGGAHFAIAPAVGMLVYVPAGTTAADRTLLRVDRDGRAVPLIEAHGAYEYPALSPDGQRVAVTIDSETGSDIWIIDLEHAATPIRFTFGDASAFPVWAPDASMLAFQSAAPGSSNLFVKPLSTSRDVQPQPLWKAVDASGARLLPNVGADLLPGTLPALSGAGPQFPTAWSSLPDGWRVAFHERNQNGDRDIWVVKPGNDPEAFVHTPADERAPRFSPDGKWLAYVSDESGRDDVWVQPFPGPGPNRPVSTTDGGTDPVWSKDGRELFYRKDDRIMVVSITPKGEFSPVRPQRLFEIRFDAGDNGPNYDVSRDGKWFVMPRGARGRIPGELHVVVNWFNEIMARTQTASAPRSSSAAQELASLRKTAP